MSGSNKIIQIPSPDSHTEFNMADISPHPKIEDDTVFHLRYWELIWYSVILVTGALGNLLVCLVIYKSSSVFRSTPFNMYICSLAATDMLLALVVLPNYVLSTSTFNHPDGVRGDVMCKTITGDFLTFYFSSVSEYSLILISLERLRSVRKFPTATINNPNRRRRTWISIITAWLIPFTFQCPKAFYILEYKREERPVIGNYCTFRWGRKPTIRAKIYGGTILLAEGLIPFLIFVYSFYTISKCLLNEERRLFGRIQGDTFNDGYRYFSCWQIVERRRKTVRVLMMVTTVFVVCWIPNKIMFFMISYLGEKNTKFTWNSPEYQVGILLGFTGSCINPYFYALQSKEFRKHSKKTLKSLLSKCLNDHFEYTKIENANRKDQNRNITIAATRKATKHFERESQLDPTESTPRSKTDPSRTDTCTPKINAVI